MFPQRRMTTDTPDGNYSQALNLFVRGEDGWVQMPSRSMTWTRRRSRRAMKCPYWTKRKTTTMLCLAVGIGIEGLILSFAAVIFAEIDLAGIPTICPAFVSCHKNTPPCNKSDPTMVRIVERRGGVCRVILTGMQISPLVPRTLPPTVLLGVPSCLPWAI